MSDSRLEFKNPTKITIQLAPSKFDGRRLLASTIDNIENKMELKVSDPMLLLQDILRPSLEGLLKKIDYAIARNHIEQVSGKIARFLDCLDKFEPEGESSDYLPKIISSLLYFYKDNNLVTSYVNDVINDYIQRELKLIEEKKSNLPVDLLAKLNIFNNEDKSITLNFSDSLKYERYIKILEMQPHLNKIIADQHPNAKELRAFLYIMHRRNKYFETISFSAYGRHSGIGIETHLRGDIRLYAEIFKYGIKHLDITNLCLDDELGLQLVTAVLKAEDCTIEVLTRNRKINNKELEAIGEALKYNSSLVTINLLADKNDPILLGKLNKYLIRNFNQKYLPIYLLTATYLIPDLASLIMDYLNPQNRLIMLGKQIIFSVEKEEKEKTEKEIQSKNEIITPPNYPKFTGIFETLRFFLQEEKELREQIDFLKKIKLLVKQNGFAEALTLLNSVLPGFVGEIETLQFLLFLKANCLLKLKRFAEVLSVVELGALLGPLNDDYFQIKYEALFAVGKYEEALASLNSMGEEENDLHLISIKSILLNKLGLHQQALECLGKILYLEPLVKVAKYQRQLASDEICNIKTLSPNAKANKIHTRNFANIFHNNGNKEPNKFLDDYSINFSRRF